MVALHAIEKAFTPHNTKNLGLAITELVMLMVIMSGWTNSPANIGPCDVRDSCM